VTVFGSLHRHQISSCFSCKSSASTDLYASEVFPNLSLICVVNRIRGTQGFICNLLSSVVNELVLPLLCLYLHELHYLNSFLVSRSIVMTTTFGFFVFLSMYTHTSASAWFCSRRSTASHITLDVVVRRAGYCTNVECFAASLQWYYFVHVTQ